MEPGSRLMKKEFTGPRSLEEPSACGQHTTAPYSGLAMGCTTGYESRLGRVAVPATAPYAFVYR